MVSNSIVAHLLIFALGTHTIIVTGVEVYKEPDLSLVHFLLWTRENPEDFGYFDLINGDSQSLSQSNYNGNLNTYFMFHGYTDVGTKQWILDAKTELLELYQCNVISVDYGALVPSPNYPAAVKNSYIVSNYTASLIDWLVEETMTTPSQMQLTGHSLGAHAAGMTAKYVTSGLIDRVTGLDPAGPLFYNVSDDQRLSKSQANFVDIIHTNAGLVVNGFEGLLVATGDVDFYPNGGSNMTGCDSDTNGAKGCSHQSVTSFWTESISNGASAENPFVSWPCIDWDTFQNGGCRKCGTGCLNMGFFVQRGLEGLYYLYTNGQSPYARGDTQVAP